MESSRADALLHDPLAALLAGKQALEFAKARERRSRATDGDSGPAQDLVAPGSQASATADGSTAAVAIHKRSLNRIVVRTLYWDDCIKAALQLPCPAFLDGLKAAAAVCKQVVLLGAGMDTRAWRLALPPGVAWFEVDRADVLAAKRRTLLRGGAQLDRLDDAKGYNGIHVFCQGGQRFKYPLFAATWRGISVDLQQPGWIAQLVAQGLDPGQPVVWLAEGLLYYLDPPTVETMLQEAASNCGRGSVLLANSISLAVLELLKQRRRGGGGGGAAALPGGVSGRGPRGEAPLTDHFVWGCPEEPEQYFGRCGWRLVSNLPWPRAAELYGQEAASLSSEDTATYVVAVS